MGEDKYANHGFLFAPFDDSSMNPTVAWLALINPYLVTVQSFIKEFRDVLP